MKFNEHQFNGLGIDPGILAAGTSIAKGIFAPKAGAPGPGGAAAPGMMPGTTISPAFQQAFTPQFSPVMQQTQDSPGATQTAAPTQTASPGQTATTGQPLAPGMPPPPPSEQPFMERPSYAAPYTRGAAPAYSPVIQTSDQTKQLMKWGLIGVLGFMVFTNMQKGKKRKLNTVKPSARTEIAVN